MTGSDDIKDRASSLLDPPPPYPESANGDGQEPTATRATRASIEKRRENNPASDAAGSSPGESASQPSPTEAKYSSTFGRLRNAISDRKNSKAAQRKVDFYEKMYGFVPKNAMTEEEWKQARARAPKVQSTTPLRAKSFFGPPS